MTQGLKKSIDDLYTVFSKYPLRSKIEGCPCCVSETDQLPLHKLPLKKLSSDDLSRFAFKALTTWGTEDDFRHFLPRIFELVATTGFGTHFFIVLDKLHYGKWKQWKQPEIDAIKLFLETWWYDMATGKTHFATDHFIDILVFYNFEKNLLKDWKISFEDAGFTNLIAFIQHLDRSHYRDIPGLSTWLIEHMDLIEKGFFHYEKQDKRLAKEISVCYDMVYALTFT